MSKHRVRGFEKIKPSQWGKDAGDWYGFDQEQCVIGYEDIKLPQRATSLSAGYDIFSPFNITIRPGNEVKLPTSIKSYMQPGEVLLAFPRSSLGFKYRLKLNNTIGVIDADYFNNQDNEGHIWVKMTNEGNKDIEIRKGDAIGQFIFMPFLLVDGDNFKGNERKGGIGSTNV